MPFWFEKGEHRRFSRIDLPVKVFVTPINLKADKQIFGLGIDYFPPTVQKKIESAREQTFYWFKHIQEQQDVLEPVFKDLMLAADYLGDWVRYVSDGRSPKEDMIEWRRFVSYAKGVESVGALQESAPKTFQYLDQMNQKIRAYFKNFAVCIDKSSPRKFVVDDSLPQEFAVDEMMAKFTDPSFSKIPLVQSLFHLNAYLNAVFDAYGEFIRDYYFRQNPKAWEMQTVNISAGGVSMIMPKRFKPSTHCDAYFYFAESERLLTVRSILVRTCSDWKESQECNAFNFEFPDLQDQLFIQQEIERFEIHNSMKVPL